MTSQSNSWNPHIFCLKRIHLLAASGLPKGGGGSWVPRNFWGSEQGTEREIDKLLLLASQNQKPKPDVEYAVTSDSPISNNDESLEQTNFASLEKN